MRVLTILVLVAAAAVAAFAVPAIESPETAEACGRCHRAIHDAWKTSAHARAMESRVFQDSLELAETEIGPETRKVCLHCHAPVAVRIGDLALRRKVSWEGVTCDFCHSMQDVSFGGANPIAKVQFGPVKSGPLKEASPSAHGAVYSAVHTTAEACAPCHEYRNALGFPIVTTYSEWKRSRAAREGKVCQSCHMYSVAGHVVDPRVARSDEAKVNLHQMPGSHSLEQLNRTIGATLNAVREGTGVKVLVEVSNRTAGHSVPTGSAIRALILDVVADAYDGQHFRAQRVYQRVVGDENGRRIGQEHLAMLRSVKEISDTRLAADEKRTEEFVFPVPAGVQSAVKATLSYYFSPLATSDAEKRVTFRTLRRLVK